MRELVSRLNFMAPQERTTRLLHIIENSNGSCYIELFSGQQEM